MELSYVTSLSRTSEGESRPSPHIFSALVISGHEPIIAISRSVLETEARKIFAHVSLRGHIFNVIRAYFTVEL